MVQKYHTLPTNDDEFWKGADVKVHTPRRVTCNEHVFVQVGSMQTECKLCGVGYNLTPGMYVENEHVWHNGTLVV